MKTIEKRKEKKEFFPSLHTNLSEMFDLDKFFNERFFETPVWNKNFLNRTSLFNRVPATNIWETDSEYVFEMAVPGMTKSDFHVELYNDLLEVRCEKESEIMEGKDKYSRIEYDYSKFYRSFNIPEYVDPNKIKAKYENGMLKVYLSKVPTTQRKPIKEIPVS